MTLSDKIFLEKEWIGEGGGIPTEDVKEFIKKREEDLHDINNGESTPAQALARLRKDAGDKLI